MRPRFPSETYIKGILAGEKVMLSRAITLIESRLASDNELAQEVIAACLPYTGKSFRIGITGVPGAGKSTFIDTFGAILTQKGHKVAVLAIDPSSSVSGGSILGDKTRMQQLSIQANAFIRPSPSGGNLGGVARKTRESLLLCEAAGYDVVIVETVGVGQSEITVRGMTDFFLLLMLPNAGDELQGIKKGIMEQADALLINKADGVFLPKARTAKALYSQALRLFPPTESGWNPPVMLCSALEGIGLEEIWDMLLRFQEHTKANGAWEKERQEQAINWMNENVEFRIKQLFFDNEMVKSQIGFLQQEIADKKISPMKAADILIEMYKHIHLNL